MSSKLEAISKRQELQQSVVEELERLSRQLSTATEELQRFLLTLEDQDTLQHPTLQ
jgi:hypothetical protein